MRCQASICIGADLGLRHVTEVHADSDSFPLAKNVSAVAIKKSRETSN